MPERINAGQALVAVAAIALLISLFLNWYEPGRSAWTVFEVWDIVLAAIGIAALVAVFPRRRDDDAGGSIVPERWLPILGGAALVIVAVSLINHPPAARGSAPEVGAWIGLAAAIVLTAGAILSRARIALVITLRSTDAPKPATPAPAPEPTDDGLEAETATQPLPPQSGN
jgi:peptidoglycan/LPS O-acetylase OafA/YrhL